MIKGLGLDLVKVERIDYLQRRWQEKFLQRIFTPAELAYCLAQSQPAVHLAARFAAKEATIKMLNAVGAGLSWQDMEVIKHEQGRPELLLKNKAEKLAQARGIKFIHLSLSHEREYAVAQVIGEG